MSEREVRWLLESLCVKLGFCLKPADRRRLMESPPADAKTFADEVILAEGLDPQFNQHQAQVLAMVQAAFERAESLTTK